MSSDCREGEEPPMVLSCREEVGMMGVSSSPV